MDKKKMTFEEKLNYLQASLKVPKNRFNDFSNFYYRSLEDIYEVIKPILKELRLVLIMSDEIIAINERFYVKATALLKDLESDGSCSVAAWAREQSIRKGMDEAQITGSASSYARKYALSGLLLLDDTKDIENGEEIKEKPQKKNTANTSTFEKDKFLQSVQNVIEHKQLPESVVKVFLEAHNLTSFEDVATREDALKIYEDLMKTTIKNIPKPPKPKGGVK